MSKTIITIMSVLAVAKIMTYCGMINDMATFFVSITGKFYPFVAPIIAALGAFITGSGTSTEVLLGALQTSAAQQIGASEFWLAAANSTGAGIGKILSPQCIATAAAAVGPGGTGQQASGRRHQMGAAGAGHRLPDRGPAGRRGHAAYRCVIRSAVRG